MRMTYISLKSWTRKTNKTNWKIKSVIPRSFTSLLSKELMKILSRPMFYHCFDFSSCIFHVFLLHTVLLVCQTKVIVITFLNWDFSYYCWILSISVTVTPFVFFTVIFAETKTLMCLAHTRFSINIWYKTNRKCLKLSHVWLCDSIDCRMPGSSVHAILQAKILEWVAIHFSRKFFDPRIKPGSPALQADSLLSDPPGKPLNKPYTFPQKKKQTRSFSPNLFLCLYSLPSLCLLMYFQ